MYSATECKGDLNNDAAVDFADIDPFVAALSGQSAFEAAYPGLGGCMRFHGDLNCDNSVDLADIDPLVARLFQCCVPTCGDCPQQRAAQGAEGPESFAYQLWSNTRPERRALLLDIALGAAALADDPERQAFWSDIAASLPAE